MSTLLPLLGRVIIASSPREASTLRKLLETTGVTVFDLGTPPHHAKGLCTKVVEMTPGAEHYFAHTQMGWDLVVTLVNNTVVLGGVSLIPEELFA